MGVLIRMAVVEDAEGINGVYNPFIAESPATFETEPYDIEDRARWIAVHLANPQHPVFVAEREDRICGFANASAFDPRDGYASSVKTSVFVDPACHSRGIAGRLYNALFEVLEGGDLHRAYALIVSPNPASVALHRRFEFEQVSTLNEVGRKFGRYYDVMWFEKKLS